MRVLEQLVLALTTDLPSASLTTRPVSSPVIEDGVNASSTSFNLTAAVVLWHGLGDQYDSDGMRATTELLKRKLPDVFVHSVHLDENPSQDKRSSMLGDANRQVEIVCDDLAGIPELAGGFAAIGFSQGGLFFRALLERCPNITISTLMTFGSPHMGVLDLPLCEDKNDWACQRRNLVLKQQVWRDAVQKTVVPAQYFRDMDHYEEYLEHSNFLAAVNNERESEGASAQKERFLSLKRLVLIKFARDQTLVPKESAFFEYRVLQTGAVVPMEGTRFYQEDLIGLKTLNEAGKVSFHTIDAEHMEISSEILEELVDTYLVGARV